MKRLVGPTAQIMQVVKADTYGHGAIEISNAALVNGASCLGVANADEGVQLRVCGITAPVIILSPATESEIDQIIKYNLVPSVSDLGFAREFQKRARKAGTRAPIHVEVDTGDGPGRYHPGGGRPGHPRDRRLPQPLLGRRSSPTSPKARSSPTTMTSSGAFSRRFWRSWRRVTSAIPVRHISNSGAILNYPQYHLDMVRPGLISYGIYPSPETRAKAALAPVMSFKTRVVLVKEFPEGYSIGYGRTFITRRPTRIATIPVGYGDGFGWMLNQGEALIRGKRVPIAGRISMDMCTLDVSQVPECRVGDEVVLMGEQGCERITADEIATKVSSISYEILCALGKRAPRIFLHQGRAGRVEPSLRRIFIPDEEKSISRIDTHHPPLLPDAGAQRGARRRDLLRDVRNPLRQGGPAARTAGRLSATPSA